MHGDMLVIVQIDLSVRAVDQCCPGGVGARLVQVDAVDGRPGVVQHAGAGAGIFFVVVTDPAQVEIFIGLEQQLRAEALARAAIQIMAVVFVFDVAVTARAIRRKTPGQLIVERAGNRALGLEIPVLADRGFDAALRREGWRAGADVDHPGGGVFAEQRALRPPQDFKLFDVHQVKHRHPRAAQIDVVDVQADAAFQAIAGRVITQATDRHAGLACVHVGDVDAGHQLLQILNPVDPLRLQILPADHAHRRRYILRTFFAAAGGDGHGFQLRTVGGGLAGRHWRGGFSIGGVAVSPARAPCQQQGQRQAFEPSWR
ncbi:hypothetical protein PS681_06121 [Pseudomonas fluorescens]|nr:hypothetical protein PS681_06121 [Pseudomonas fluorescens]